MSVSVLIATFHYNDSQPDDYITVFSLRNWGKLRDVLTTEQVRRIVILMALRSLRLGLHPWEGLHRR